jgi:hypothetical protein
MRGAYISDALDRAHAPIETQPDIVDGTQVTRSVWTITENYKKFTVIDG